MIIGILKEPDFETRVSILAEGVQVLKKEELTVWVQTDAGVKAYCSNENYINAGAEIKSAQEISQHSDVIFSMHFPSNELLPHLQNKILIGVYQPLLHKQQMQLAAQNKITVCSLDMLPRTTRAQGMDVLSSQANIAGYKAVLLAANIFSGYLPMFITAAGSVKPACVLILGAGVAGLQAIATAKRLGAVVEVFDTRPAVKEEVQSLGAKFIEVEGAADASKAGGYAVEQSSDFKEKQNEKIAFHIAKANIVITTAQIPGKKAPILITEQMMNAMKPGSIIVDLAAATGGNTPFTINNETVAHGGVSIVGNSALAATMPSDASKLYGKNCIHFFKLIYQKEQGLKINLEDELLQGACIVNDGEIIHEKIKNL